MASLKKNSNKINFQIVIAAIVGVGVLGGAVVCAASYIQLPNKVSAIEKKIWKIYGYIKKNDPSFTFNE